MANTVLPLTGTKVLDLTRARVISSVQEGRLIRHLLWIVFAPMARLAFRWRRKARGSISAPARNVRRNEPAPTSTSIQGVA